MLKRILGLAVVMLGLTAAPALADDPQYPPQDDLKIEVSTTALCPGDSVTVSGSGFEAASSVVIELASNETNLGSATVDGEGGFSFESTIPETQEPGDYTVRVSGTAADGSEAVETAALQVQDCDEAGPTTTAPGAAAPSDDDDAAGSLPVTGSDAMTLLKIGLALAALGGLLLALARRRRRAAMSPAAV